PESPATEPATEPKKPDPAPSEPAVRAEELGLRVGQRVRHAKFGTGKVRRLDAAGGSLRATVEFRVGLKTLDLDFTRLEPLGDGS
ncbi:MAG: ATP-dependent DNA helicase PcrA, partial [Planctomycetaceae bacterium]|nr:ATP-dependent DNA helicase PcrA [Planctomycetaceae bacterium]